MSNEKLIPELRFPEFVKDGEWKEKELKEVFNSFSGGTPSTSEKGYYGGNIPFIRSAEIGKEKTELFLTEEGLKNSSAKLVNKGDLLVALYGANSGDVAISKIDGAINQAILCLKSDYSNTFTYNFLFLYKDWLVSRYIQGGQGNLSGDIVKSIRLSFPKKNEQQKIASCLSSLDELITAHNDKLQALKDHKKGLMQNLFPHPSASSGSGAVAEPVEAKVPKFRFPEFEKDGEWSEKALGNLIDIKGRIGYRGYTINDIVIKGEGAISMSPSNIDDFGYLKFEKSTYISWSKYEESPEIMLEEGFTVLVKTGSSYGKAAFVTNLVEKTTINPQLVVLKPINIHARFLYLIVANASIQRQINETVVGGAIPTLSQDSISKFEVLIPKPKEQQKIASCLSALDELITAQSEKIEQLKEHKKGLMQGLFPKIV